MGTEVPEPGRPAELLAEKRAVALVERHLCVSSVLSVPQASSVFIIARVADRIVLILQMGN